MSLRLQVSTPGPGREEPWTLWPGDQQPGPPTGRGGESQVRAPRTKRWKSRIQESVLEACN